jgi:DNA polymerase-3 subunit gamma/tau
MTHTALARKYRPTRFSDLVAQEHVAVGLKGAVAKQRVAHAYLLTGPRGVGKTTAARVLAMALNCERREAEGGLEGEPCGACDSCRRIWSGAANLDVVEIDAASNRGVDDARDLRERAMYAASGPDRYKVYIIDEAHMLTREAWNALLKILEEPPPRVVFVFATTEPHKIANTAAPVLSRVQRFDFRRIGPDVIVERLRYVTAEERIAAEDDALRLIAKVAAGGMRDALSLLDQAVAFGDGAVTAAGVREALGLIADEVYAELLATVAERRADGVFPLVARLVDSGADLAEFINGLGDTLRALLIRMLGGTPEAITEVLRHAVDAYATRFTAGDVLRMLQLLQEAEAAVRRSANARLQVESLLLRCVLLDRTVELRDVLAALGGAGSSGAGAPPRPAAPEPPSGRGVRGRDVMRDAAPPPGSAKGTTPPAAPSGTSNAAPDAAALLARWADIVEVVRQRRPVVAAALEHARPAAVQGDEVLLTVGEGETIHLEGLARNRADVEAGILAVCGSRMRVTCRPAPADPAPKAGSETAGRRLDSAGDREQRLKAYRAKDQALDAVADALDLELLE